MYNALKFALFSSMFIACASPTPINSYTLILDDSLSETTKSQAVQAVAAWDTILDGKLSIRIVSHSCGQPNGFVSAVSYGLGQDPSTICMVASTATYVDSIAQAESGYYVGGYTLRYPDVNSSITYLPMDRDVNKSSTEMIEIITHELGHGMGMEHTQAGTLMCWQTGCQTTAPTCDDQTQWSDIRGLSNKNASCLDGGSYTLEH